MRCGEAYGSLPPPPSEFLKNTNPLYVQTGSREAGCLVRGGPLRRGRGEAAGDCVDGEEPFHTAAVERTGARAFAASTNSLYYRRRGWRPRPGSVGKNSNREVKRRWRKSSRGKVHRPTAGSRSGVEGQASVKRGGRRDRRQLSRDQRSDSGTIPVSSSAVVQNTKPDPGLLLDDTEAGDDKLTQKQPEGAAREDRADLRCRRAPGAPAT